MNRRPDLPDDSEARSERDLLLARARRLARPTARPLETPRAEHLVFVRMGDRYALPLLDVCEVARHARWTALPETPSGLLGVTVLRGEPLALFDPRALVWQADTAPANPTPVLVLGRGDDVGSRLGLAADEIIGLLPPARGPLAPITEAAPHARAIVRGVTGDGVMLLDAARLLSGPEAAAGTHERAAEGEGTDA